MEATTKTERAIAFIQNKGSARTPEIAEHLGIPTKNVMPLLKKSVDDGVLVSCSVEQANGKRCNEYRVIGAEPRGAGKGFTIVRPAAVKPPVAPAPSKAVTPAPTPAEISDSFRRSAERATKPRFLLSDDGQLQIEEGETCIALGREDTTRLWRFMGGFLSEVAQ